MSPAIQAAASRARVPAVLETLEPACAERPTDERFAHLVFTGDPSPAIERPLDTPSRRPRGPARSERPLEAPGADFCAWICDRAGLDVAYYRPSVLRRRLPACLRALGAGSLDQARATIEAEPVKLEAALGALLIGVTEFFRDEATFDALGPLLGDLAAGAPPGTGPRVLSLGCSAGQELYSVAMLLAEQDLLVGAGQLVGVDARQRAIEAARAGLYSSSVAEHLSRSRRERWLEREGARLRVVDELRTACRFELGDALTATLGAELDLLLCRNLSIYLEPEACRKLWDSISRCLRPGGLLVTGKAERPCGEPFVGAGPCLYRRV